MKDTLIKGIDFFSGRLSLQKLIKLSGTPLISPFYHTVSDVRLPHIANIYPQKTKKLFIRDLDFLLKNFQPVDLIQLQNIAQGKLKITKPSFFLSFDDGLSGFYDVIAPILLQKGVPATVFLNSAFVDNKELFYRYKISLILEKLRTKHLGKSTLLEICNILKIEDEGKIKKALLDYHEVFGSVPGQLASLSDIDFKDYLKNETPYLTTTQIRELTEKGFHFGAHSIDHPYFSKLSFEQQLIQINESMDFVKNLVRCRVAAFAFPFTDYGVGKKFFQTISSDNICQISMGTAGLKLEEFPFHFQRIPMERENLPAQIIIATEYVYFLIKKFLGKNQIRRTL